MRPREGREISRPRPMALVPFPNAAMEAALQAYAARYPDRGDGAIRARVATLPLEVRPVHAAEHLLVVGVKAA